MKKIFISLLFLMHAGISFANHLKGGWVYYEALGPGATQNSIKYRITIKQYLDCHSTTQQIDQEVFLGIFNNQNNSLNQQITVQLTGSENLNKSSFNPCISFPPEVCYRIDRYVTTVDLPSNTAGYTLSVQRCCRIAGIVNIIGSSLIGVSYTTTIPGNINGIFFGNNNSPQFAQKDTVAICINGNFTFDFSATDLDQDSLIYGFCPGLVGGGPGPTQARPSPPSSPPYSSVPYSNNYSGLTPMTSNVTVNPKTGLISGKAPSTTGDYVVAVCVSEFRNGIKIGETRKEIHITVASCTIAAAELKQPGYQLCDSATFTFKNESPASNIIAYSWTFGDIASGSNNTSTAPEPTHGFSDTGVYSIKLKVQSAAGCTDSTTSLVNVYPGYKPDFSFTGSCYKSPFQFTDKTTSRYGMVNSWNWDFGDLSSVTDISTARNPIYQYAASGGRTARLIVADSKGCIDTIFKPVPVNDIPVLTLPFKDTLICSIDTLQLRAEGSGLFSWNPSYNIINANSPNPYVYPKSTTNYAVTLNENGCSAIDSIRVNVLHSITVNAGADTTICATDTIRFKPVSQGLQYQWTPASQIVGATNIKNALANPLITTSYHVVASLGKCQANDEIIVNVTPYPKAYAGGDAAICYGTNVVLPGSIEGAYFTWSPSGSLLNAQTLKPIASPLTTTSYVLTAFDTIGCPKPARDTVVVTVVPQVHAFAGNDTAIVANQPLQLNATGGTVYSWRPGIGMNNAASANPVITLGPSYDSVIYTVRVSLGEGCYKEDDIKVKIFKTRPDIFIPSAFTPNNDGRNDFFKPIPVGIKSIRYFRIFNRWGQLVYHSAPSGLGWDGTFAGKPQASGTYVYMTEGTDYLDKNIFKKGTIVLIR